MVDNMDDIETTETESNTSSVDLKSMRDALEANMNSTETGEEVDADVEEEIAAPESVDQSNQVNQEQQIGRAPV